MRRCPSRTSPASFWVAARALSPGSATRAGRSRRTAKPSLAPYVPTPHDVVERMLRPGGGDAKNDVVYDLGCGDGRLVITAAKKHGARGVGIDIDPERIAESRANAQAGGRRTPGVVPRQDAHGHRRVRRHGGDALPAVLVEPQAPPGADAPAEARARASSRTPSAWATGSPRRASTTRTRTAARADSTCGGRTARSATEPAPGCAPAGRRHGARRGIAAVGRRP